MDDTDVVYRDKCTFCGAELLLTQGDKLAMLAKLDPRYPSNTITIDCKCNREQFVIQAFTSKEQR